MTKNEGMNDKEITTWRSITGLDICTVWTEPHDGVALWTQSLSHVTEKQGHAVTLGFGMCKYVPKQSVA